MSLSAKPGLGQLKTPLQSVIQGVPGIVRKSPDDVLVSGVAYDSRDVSPGNIFVALKGAVVDGHNFIQDAIQRGAAAVVGTQAISELPVPYIQVEDSRQSLAFISAALFQYPARQLVVIAVTGTDGKTTTANLIFKILRAANVRVGMITTVNAVIGDEVLDTGFHVTTPEAPDVQYYLARMVQAGLTHVVLEATSHGLAQHRVTATDVDIGVLTNITHEHLDYHGSYEAYREAKARLFTGLPNSPQKEIAAPVGAVLNRDDSSFEFLAAATKAPVLTYGVNSPAHVNAENIRQTPGGLRFTALISLTRENKLRSGDVRIPLECNLEGGYNVLNCLAAVTTTYNIMQVEKEAIIQGIKSLQSIPGRMERISMGQEFLSIVDFAHTPNALKNVLESARSIVAGKQGKGRIIAIFGSAGLRDKAKRRLMSQVSADLADLTVLTAEDPRTESLESILSEMAEGVISCGGEEGKTFWRIPDRREAIRFGISIAQPGDLVIACGKGHEQSMCFGDVEYDWDDRVAMRAALAEHLGIAGPEMPFLPTQE